VLINAGDHGRFVSQSQPNQNPIFQRRAQFVFTFAESCAERSHAFELGDFAGERAVIQLVVTRQFQGGFNAGGERKRQGKRLIDFERKQAARYF